MVGRKSGRPRKLQNLRAELTYGTTVYGRRRWADSEDRADHRDWNRFQLATNFEVQGAATDALRIALAPLYQQFANGARPESFSPSMMLS